MGAVGAPPFLEPSPPPSLFHPLLYIKLLIRLFIGGGFYLLLFEVHLLLSLSTLVPAEQKDVNNTKPKRKQFEKKAWVIHVLNTQPQAKWVSGSECLTPGKTVHLEVTGQEGSQQPLESDKVLARLLTNCVVSESLISLCLSFLGCGMKTTISLLT